MCDFKEGDDIQCIDDTGLWANEPRRGQVYVAGKVQAFGDQMWVQVPGFRYAFLGFLARRFRKVERRNDRLSIEAFMTMPGGFEEPRRPKAPAKKRERVQ